MINLTTISCGTINKGKIPAATSLFAMRIPAKKPIPVPTKICNKRAAKKINGLSVDSVLRSTAK